MSAAAWTCAADRAAEELGFQPEYPLERGMQDTLDWFRRHP
jgi:nucleoside-diphosphate-sugar epimerase